ncbi:MAG: hypothetical protein Q9217_003631 [Psora testacea]
MSELYVNLWDQANEITSSVTQTSIHPRTFDITGEQIRMILTEETLTETERNWIRDGAGRHETEALAIDNLRLLSMIHDPPITGGFFSSPFFSDEILTDHASTLLRRTTVIRLRSLRDANCRPREEQKTRQRYNLGLLQRQYGRALEYHASMNQQTKGIVDFEEAMNRAKRTAGGLVLKAGNRLAKILEAEGDGGFTGLGNEVTKYGRTGYLDEIRTYWMRAGTNNGLLPVWQYVKEWEDTISPANPSTIGIRTGAAPGVERKAR